MSPSSAGTDQALDALMLGLADDSALLRHEICYVLGQLRKSKAIPVLVNLLEADRDVMVRHEAAEALGAIADPAVLDKEQLDQVILVLKVLIVVCCFIMLDTYIYLSIPSFIFLCRSNSFYCLFRNICLMLLLRFPKPAKLPLMASSGV
jgi:deoxyhypusine monooxygenase